MNVVNWIQRLVLRKKGPTPLEKALCDAIADEDTRRANGLALWYYVSIEDWRRAAVCRDRLKGGYRLDEFDPENSPD